MGAIIAGGAAAATALPATVANASAPSPAEPATLEQMAAMNFEPWSHDVEDEWTPPSNEQWTKDGRNLLPYVRLAWFAMYKTKAELEAVTVRLDGEDLFEALVCDIGNAREYFENFVKVLDYAECRLNCAAAAQWAEEPVAKTEGRTVTPADVEAAERAYRASHDAMDALIQTAPVTMAGLKASIAYLIEWDDE